MWEVFQEEFGLPPSSTGMHPDKNKWTFLDLKLYYPDIL